MNMPQNRGRIRGLRRALRDLDAILISDINNVKYLTGFTGSSGVAIVTRKHGFFITDFRYKDQAAKEVCGEGCEYELVVERSSIPVLVKNLCTRLGIGRLGVEDSVPYSFFIGLQKHISGIRAVSGVVQKLRAVKDALEICNIKEAIRRAEAAFKQVKPYIRAGASERSIALRLERGLKKMGCRRMPFDIIVASGNNSAMPHAAVTDRKIRHGDLVTIDWGGEAGGYFSDMTRTLLLRGNSTGGKRRIYSLVLEANRKSVSAIAPGTGSSEIDNTARHIIKKAGYGEFFGHALGHGVGMEVHELPRIASKGSVRLKPGMVFTIEPGIYVPGVGGVRIEDMVAVSENGAEVLTTLPRKLQVI
jgi:Xaa-Pro aminopeptidase